MQFNRRPIVPQIRSCGARCFGSVPFPYFPDLSICWYLLASLVKAFPVNCAGIGQPPYFFFMHFSVY